MRMLNVSNGAWHQVSTQQRWAIYVTVSIIVIKGWGTMRRGGAVQPALRGHWEHREEGFTFCAQGDIIRFQVMIA